MTDIAHRRVLQGRWRALELSNPLGYPFPTARDFEYPHRVGSGH